MSAHLSQELKDLIARQDPKVFHLFVEYQLIETLERSPQAAALFHKARLHGQATYDAVMNA